MIYPFGFEEDRNEKQIAKKNIKGTILKKNTQRKIRKQSDSCETHNLQK